MINNQGDILPQSYEDFINDLLHKYFEIIIPYPNSVIASNNTTHEYEVYIHRKYHGSFKCSIDARQYIMTTQGKKYSDILFLKEKLLT